MTSEGYLSALSVGDPFVVSGGEGKAEKLCLSEQKSLPEVEEKHRLR